jgi:hypothetical protein
MHTYSDDVINNWADVYQACRLHQTGIRFETFITAPTEILARLGMSDAEEIMRSGFLPLLPAQAQVRMELSQQSAASEEPHRRQRPARPSAMIFSWSSPAANNEPISTP